MEFKLNKNDLMHCQCTKQVLSLSPVKEYGNLCNNCGKRKRTKLSENLVTIDGEKFLPESCIKAVLAHEIKAHPSESAFEAYVEPSNLFHLKLIILTDKIIDRGSIFESDVVYFLMMIRKIIEASPKKNYELIRHFINWPVHKEIDKSEYALKILSSITASTAEFINGKISNEEYSVIFQELATKIIDFAELRIQLIELLKFSEHAAIPMILEDEYWWSLFCFRYLESVTGIHLTFPKSIDTLNDARHKKIRQIYSEAKYVSPKINFPNGEVLHYFAYRIWISTEIESKSMKIHVDCEKHFDYMNYFFITKTNTDNTFEFCNKHLKIF